MTTIPLKTSPEIAAWIDRHGRGGIRPISVPKEAEQPLLIERDPAEGFKRRTTSRP